MLTNDLGTSRVISTNNCMPTTPQVECFVRCSTASYTCHKEIKHSSPNKMVGNNIFIIFLSKIHQNNPTLHQAGNQ
jgi:hypothetical protein